MKFRNRTQPSLGTSGVVGAARVDRRTSAVLRRAHPGDVAVLDHLDLDRGSAEALLEHGVVAVVNASPFLSGRYPALGPEILARAGLVLVEGVGAEAFSAIREGARVTVLDGELRAGDKVVARGRAVDLDDVLERMDAARAGIASQLQSFTHNTTEFLRREQELLLHGQGVPELRVRIAGRPVVVVVRDFDYAADLKRLRRFIREQDPVLLAVDGGADALLEVRLKPDLLVLGVAGLAPPASNVQARPVSDKALRSSRQVLLHADASDRIPGAERLDRLGIRPARMSASGTTEDIALLVADIGGASTIITVGTHATLDEFLDRQRAGLASTFLTRLRVGPRVVDAKAVPVLYAGRVRLWHLLLVLLVGLLTVAVAVASTPLGAQWFEDLGDALARLFDQIRGLLP